MISLRLTGAAAAALCLTLAGCGSKKRELSGTVTLYNKPLLVGKLVLVGDDNERSDLALIAGGKFTVRNAPVGPSVKVVVENESVVQELAGLRDRYKAVLQPFGGNLPPSAQQVPASLRKQYEEAQELRGQLDQMAGVVATRGIIPAQFTRELTTPLTIDTSGSGDVDIQLR